MMLWSDQSLALLFVFTARCYASAVLAIVVCALSNGDIADDLECPLTAPFSAFCTAIHSVVTDEPRDFKFGTLTYHSKSHPQILYTGRPSEVLVL